MLIFNNNHISSHLISAVFDQMICINNMLFLQMKYVNEFLKIEKSYKNVIIFKKQNKTVNRF